MNDRHYEAYCAEGRYKNLLIRYTADTYTKIMHYARKILTDNPLINWTDDDVWRYIRDEKIPYNPLYDCGWHRVGCIVCPMAQRRVRAFEFERYPKYRDRFIRIADKIVEMQKQKKGKDYNGAPTGLLYFKRWMEDDNVVGQYSFDMDGNITEDYT